MWLLFLWLDICLSVLRFSSMAEGKVVKLFVQRRGHVTRRRRNLKSPRPSNEKGVRSVDSDKKWLRRSQSDANGVG